MDIMGVLKNTVSITLFNKGKAGQIFESVKKTGAKVVMKNNEAECVLLSPEEYTKLIEQLNDIKLLNIALQRMNNYNPEKTVSQKQLDEEFGFTEDDLKDYEKVEFE